MKKDIIFTLFALSLSLSACTFNAGRIVTVPDEETLIERYEGYTILDVGGSSSKRVMWIEKDDEKLGVELPRGLYMKYKLKEGQVIE